MAPWLPAVRERSFDCATVLTKATADEFTTTFVRLQFHEVKKCG